MLAALTYVLIQVAVVALCLKFTGAIRKHAVVFYFVAIALNVVYLIGYMFPGSLPTPLWNILFITIKRCILGMAFWVVVMYTGVLPKSDASRKLRSIRGEMSIIAWILSLGHLVFLRVIPPILANLGKLNAMTAIGCAISILLFILLVVLGVTSFRCVKRHMKAGTWRSVQKWAYAFYALTYAHLVCMLAPSALSFGQKSFALASLLCLLVYTAVFGYYSYLRFIRPRQVRNAEYQDQKLSEAVAQGALRD